MKNPHPSKLTLMLRVPWMATLWIATLNSLKNKVAGPALVINIIPLPVTMNRKIKKPPVKLNFQQSQ